MQWSIFNSKWPWISTAFSGAVLEKVVYVYHLNTMKMSSVNLSVGIGFISNPWGYDACCIHDITYIIEWTSCYSTGSRGLHTLTTCTPEYSLTHNTAVWPSSVYSVHLEDSDYLDIFGMKLELLISAQSLPTTVQTVLIQPPWCYDLKSSLSGKWF